MPEEIWDPREAYKPGLETVELGIRVLHRRALALVGGISLYPCCFLASIQWRLRLRSSLMSLRFLNSLLKRLGEPFIPTNVQFINTVRCLGFSGP
jgi:hypothetical protein